MLNSSFPSFPMPGHSTYNKHSIEYVGTSRCPRNSPDGTAAKETGPSVYARSGNDAGRALVLLLFFFLSVHTKPGTKSHKMKEFG